MKKHTYHVRASKSAVQLTTQLTPSSTYTITGHHAIRIAERDGLTLRKYADPTEPARHDLTEAEAREIARSDASLVYIRVTHAGWTGPHDGYSIGDYFASGDHRYCGPDDDGIEPTWQDA